MTDLTIEELAELEKQLTVSDNADEYVCGRCGADYHLHDERNEPSALCDSCAQEVVENVTPKLLAMARELVRLRTKAHRVTHRDVTEDELSHVAELAIDARNSILTPGGSSAPVVRWLMWQEDRGLAVALELLTRNQELTRLKSALAFLAERGWWSPSRRTPAEICDYATTFGWKDPTDPTTPKAEG